jgi:hypothetical protein
MPAVLPSTFRSAVAVCASSCGWLAKYLASHESAGSTAENATVPDHADAAAGGDAEGAEGIDGAEEVPHATEPKSRKPKRVRLSITPPRPAGCTAGLRVVRGAQCGGRLAGGRMATVVVGR